MMKKIFIFIALLAVIYAQSQESDKYKIVGQLVDENGVLIPFANAALFSTDSLLVTGAVSDGDGNFMIITDPGQFYLRLSFLSYEEKIISPLIVSNSDLNLGKIKMLSQAAQLDELVVQGERSQMELYLDKRVFNVGKDLSNISGSAADILDNVPSVTVDVDGNVNLRGSGNVRILIDGKPSGLTGISTADALQQLQANLIESVEVITNPSARYDAEGEVGIINIVLKKERRKGVNGSFALNAGYPLNYGGSYSLNFRKEKFNLFSSYGLNYRSGPGRGHSFQKFDRVDPITMRDTTFSYYQEDKRNRSGLSHNIRVGSDIFINDKNTITASLVIRKSDGRNTSNYIFQDYDALDNLVKTVDRNEVEKEPEINSEIGVNYRREFNRKDQVLTADFKWIENDETEKSEFEQFDDSDGSTIHQRSINTEDERNILAQVDYLNPFKNSKGKWETGLKASSRILGNRFQVEEQDDSEQWNILNDYDNDVVYTENIYAGYFIAGNEWNRFSLQGGIRGELSDISVELKKTNQTAYQNYFNLFPSAHLSYKLSEQKTIQLSYSYRISRPRFRELLPFSGFSNNRAIWGGNPNLRPEYTNSIEAGYLLNWTSGSILSSAYYRYRTGVIERVPLSDPNTGFVRPFPINLATENNFGLEFNFSWNPVKWWRFNTSANFFRAITDGTYEEINYFADTYTWNTRSTSRITFLKKLDFQTGFNYRAPRQTPTGSNKAMYHIDLGLSYDVFKGNGTLTFNVRDLLNSRKFRGTTQTNDFYSESVHQWRVRQMNLTFTYRLNQKKDRQRGRDRDEDGEWDDDNEFNGGEFNNNNN